MKVLVTGGAGFIGTHLTESLLGRGHSVRILDHNAPKQSGLEWSEGDLLSAEDCERAAKGVDAVIHLAARIQRPGPDKNRSEYLDANVLGTKQILSAAWKSKVHRFVFTSSCEVYGNTPLGGADEESSCKPVSPSVACKYAAEQGVLAHSIAHPEMTTSIMRVFNTFGEYQRPYRPGSVIATFILRSLNGKDLIIKGDGSQIRDFLYVKDVALAHVVALEKGIEGIYNVASQRPHNVRGLADLIVLKTGRGRVTFAEDPAADVGVACSVGNASKLRNATGWQPSQRMEEALDNVVGWYGSHIHLYEDAP